MATWKKILLDGDAVVDNLATDNLTQDESSRVYSLNGDTNSLSFKGGITQMVDTSNDQEFSFDTVNRVFDVHNGNSIRFREDDDNNFVALKADATVGSDYTITLPGSAPGGNNKILESDSNGNLSWITTPSGGGGGSTTINNNADNLVITGSNTSDTLEAEAKLTFNNSVLNVSGTDLAAGNGVSIFGGTYSSNTNPYISPVGTNSVLKFGDSATGSIFDFRQNKIAFDDDLSNTYIQADANDPENLKISADGNLQFYTSSSGTTSLTLELTSSNQALFTRDVIMSDNNRRLIGTLSDGTTTKSLIKANSSDQLEVGEATIDTVIASNNTEVVNLKADSIEASNSGLSSEGAYGEGSIVTFFDTGTTSVSAGRVYYYSGTAWAAFDSTTESKQTCLLGIALGTQEDDGFLLQGFVNIAEDTDFSAGKLCFVGSSARITTTAPTSGFQRILGHAVTDDVMYFNPSQEYIDLA